MKLIIGHGYLGKRIAALWKQVPGEVFATTRSPERAALMEAEGLRPVLCDVLDPGPLPEVREVVYCVGYDRSAGVPMRRVYVEGVVNVLAKLPGSPRIVYVSSTGVYGQSDGGLVDETAATEPAEESGRVVLDAERELRRLAPSAIVLRFAGIYGPGRLLRERDIRAGAALAVDPEKWLNLIHVEDGARAVLGALTKAEPGETLNVCDDRPARRREFYGRLAEVLGAPPPTFVAGPPETVNRRIDARRIKGRTGLTWAYPTFVEGLGAPRP